MRSGALRVLMTADTLGGVFSYAIDLSAALTAHGVEVVLATMGRPASAEQRRRAAGVPNVTLVESEYRLEWMDDPWDDVTRSGAWLLALERRHRPDVVHLNGYAHGALPFRAPVVVVGHSCVLSWWQAVLGEDAPERYGVYRERVATGLRAAERVVAPSATMLAALRRHYVLPPRQLVIPNGCELERFVPREKQPFVAAAGRMWDHAKNLEALAVAARDLSWPVRIAGEAERPAGVGGAESAKVPGPELLGQLSRDALASLLGRASIYAFPARYEPFGLSVLEAASAGAALVLGDIPSMRERWEGAALFVDPSSPAQLREAIEALIREPEQRRELAGRAKVIAQRHDLRRFAAEYYRLYRELAPEVAARRAPSVLQKTAY